MLPSGKTLPITVREYRAVLYETETVELSESEALRLAFVTMREKIAVAVGDGEMIAKELTAQAGENSCVVQCRLTYLTNIAEKCPITIEN